MSDGFRDEGEDVLMSGGGSRLPLYISRYRAVPTLLDEAPLIPRPRAERAENASSPPECKSSAIVDERHPLVIAKSSMIARRGYQGEKYRRKKRPL